MLSDTEGRQYEEARPLLAHQSQPELPTRSLGPRNPHIWRFILSTAAVALILSMSMHISLVPQTAILQDIICRKYYAQQNFNSGARHVPLSEDKCKIEPIQTEVAYINGWRDVTETLPAILLAVPYGRYADSAGRKKGFLLSIVGVFMNDLWIKLVYSFPNFLPLRIVWLGGLWQVIGAGAAGLSAISYVLIADICPPEQRIMAFSQINAAGMLSQLLLVPAGGALTEVNPWVPMWISSAFIVLGFLIAFHFVPETLQWLTQNQSHNHQSLTPSTSEPPSTTQNNLHHYLRSYIAESKNLSGWILKNFQVILVLCCFFAYNLGMSTNGHLLLQYAAKQLDWPLSKASYLLSLDAGVHLLILAFAIPAISSILLHMKLHELAKDKFIAQISSIFLVIGSGILFTAVSWPLLVIGQFLTSCGTAFTVPARSVVTSMVEKDNLGLLYTAITVLTYCGILVGGPLFASMFQLGMHLGDPWVGFPFFVSGVSFLLAFFAISAAVIRDNDQDTGPSVVRTNGTGENERA